MIQRPCFKRQFQAQVTPDQVVLFSDSAEALLEHPLVRMMAPHINGANTAPDIAGKLNDRISILDVQFGLSMLEEEGYIVNATDEAVSGDFTERWDVAELRGNLLETAISVRALPSLVADCMTAALLAAGAQSGPDGGFEIVLTDNGLREELETINTENMRRGRPWMLVQPAGTIPWIGPMFYPGATACWSCLRRRLEEKGRTADSLSPQTPGIDPAAIRLAAAEFAKHIAQPSKRRARLLTWDMEAARITEHHVVRLDDCPACGRKNPPPPPAPPNLASNRKILGSRAASLENVRQSLRRHISPVTGIVDGISSVNVSGPVFVSVARPGFAGRNGMPRALQHVIGGKGTSRLHADVGALGETLERYSGLFRDSVPRIRASYRGLQDAAIHPNACMLFSERQYADREKWNAIEAEYNWVPQPFDEHAEIDWSPAWSFASGSYRYIPTAYCYYKYPHARDHDFCRADSNGVAAGSSLEEAIVHGFFELVERDAVALWWYSRARRPAVAPDGCGHPYVGAVSDHYRQLRREFHVLDLTSDLGIPTFAAISPGTPPAHTDILIGFSANFDPELALAGALLEMNQFLYLVQSGRERHIASESLPDTSFLYPDPACAPVEIASFFNASRDDLRDDVLACAEIARSRGLDMMMLDQTRGDVGLYVAKVMAPGLRPFWARFAPGRLYDAPAKLGWVKHPMSEDEMNPSHLFL